MLQHDHELADDGAGQFQAQLGGRQVTDMPAELEGRQFLAEAALVSALGGVMSSLPLEEYLPLCRPVE